MLNNSFKTICGSAVKQKQKTTTKHVKSKLSDLLSRILLNLKVKCKLILTQKVSYAWSAYKTDNKKFLKNFTFSIYSFSGNCVVVFLNRRVPEITGEIFLYIYIPGEVKHPEGRTPFQTRNWSIYWHIQVHDFRIETLVCDRYWQTFKHGPLSRTMVFLVGPHPFEMADWLNGLQTFIIYTVFLIKKKKCKDSSVASAASSVELHGWPKADHCVQRIKYRTRNSEAGFSIPSLAPDCE